MRENATTRDRHDCPDDCPDDPDRMRPVRNRADRRRRRGPGVTNAPWWGPIVLRTHGGKGWVR